jgi:TetR/AcrR family transcriptional regulator, transcriptional repressor for nem operon
MARPKTYERDAVVKAARDAFWENGYEGTAVSELELRTGLNRSSLYNAFGSKSALFAEALDRYGRDVLDPLLTPLETDPGLAGIHRFLAGVRAIIEGEMDRGPQGCLMVNTIAELSTKHALASRRTLAFRDRLQGALAKALEAGLIGTDPTIVSRRAAMLLASVLGIWTCARIDLAEAASMCDTVAEEVDAWSSADLNLPQGRDAERPPG